MEVVKLRELWWVVLEVCAPLLRLLAVNPNAKAVRKSMLTYAAQQHERNKELTLKRRRRAQARAALFGDEMPAELPEDQQLEAPRRLTHVAAGGQPGQEEQGEEEGQGEGQGEGQVGPRPSQPQQPPVMAPPGDLGAHWPLPGACPENVTEVDGMKLGVGVDGERLTTPPAWVSEQGLVEELEELELARQVCVEEAALGHNTAQVCAVQWRLRSRQQGHVCRGT